MAKTRGYKRVEISFVRTLGRFFRSCISAVGSFVSAVFHGGRRKLTIMVVPHSQKRVVNFQTTMFSLVSFIAIAVGIVASFFWFTRNSIDSTATITRLQQESRETRASLDRLKDETGSLLKAAQNFQSAFS